MSQFDRRVPVENERPVRLLVMFTPWPSLFLLAILAMQAVGLDEMARHFGRSLGVWLGIGW